MGDLVTDEEITLGAWEGDENALGALVVKHFGAFERAIAKKYPVLGTHDIEDVVALGIRRFWEHRHEYDGQRALVGYVFGFIKNVAREHVACRLKWQKARAMETLTDPTDADQFRDLRTENRLDDIEEKHKGFLEAIKTVLAQMQPIDKAIWMTFAFAREDVNAGELGRKLGNEFQNGEPIPAGTVRVKKSRSLKFVADEMYKLGFDLDSLERKR